MCIAWLSINGYLSKVITCFNEKIGTVAFFFLIIFDPLSVYARKVLCSTLSAYIF